MCGVLVVLVFGVGLGVLVFVWCFGVFSLSFSLFSLSPFSLFSLLFGVFGVLVFWWCWCAGVWVCLVFWCFGGGGVWVFWCFGVLVVLVCGCLGVWVFGRCLGGVGVCFDAGARGATRGSAAGGRCEDEIENALRKINKFVIFDLQKIVNSFAKPRTIAL